MTTFIFLHGSFHAAWNWHKVLPFLEACGHRCVALDLPGHGRDRTEARDVTLDRCVEAVVDEIARAAGRVVLVAHSRNGIVISQAAERCPDRIAGLVYLAAYLVPDGRSMMEYAIHDHDSLVVQNVWPRFPMARVRRLIRLFRSAIVRRWLPRLLPNAMQIHWLDRNAYKEALYHDCPDEITQLANVLLEAEPNWAGFTPLRLSAACYGRVPKVYIECLQDRAVTPELQRRMLGETPCDRVFSLDSGHSPFFSQPAALSQTLIDSLEVFAS
jgi:pimeloyl-ACP methyl ester carboxylesterase